MERGQSRSSSSGTEVEREGTVIKVYNKARSATEHYKVLYVARGVVPKRYRCIFQNGTAVSSKTVAHPKPVFMQQRGVAKGNVRSNVLQCSVMFENDRTLYFSPLDATGRRHLESEVIRYNESPVTICYI